MLPTLRAGDRLLVRYDVPPRAGQVVVVRFPDGTLAVKRATVRDGAGWWVERDNPREGTDSATVGTIPDHRRARGGAGPGVAASPAALTRGSETTGPFPDPLWDHRKDG